MASGVIKPTLPTSYFMCKPIAISSSTAIELDYTGYENLTVIVAREGKYAFIVFDVWSGVSILEMYPENFITINITSPKKVKLQCATIAASVRGMAFYITNIENG